MDLGTVEQLIIFATFIYIVFQFVNRLVRIELKNDILHKQLSKLSDINIKQARQISFIKNATHHVFYTTSKDPHLETRDTLISLLDDACTEYTSEEEHMKHLREEYFELKIK